MKPVGAKLIQSVLAKFIKQANPPFMKLNGYPGYNKPGYGIKPGLTPS